MKTNLTLGVIGLVLFISWGLARIIANIQFDINCGDYISQAATSPNPSIAASRLTAAITFANNNGLTKGNTGVVFDYPTNDVGFWYQRLVDSQNILNGLAPNDSPLEVSNTMMRVHETLVHSRDGSGPIVVPDGISIFPNNRVYAVWGFGSLILMLFGFITAVIISESY